MGSTSELRTLVVMPQKPLHPTYYALLITNSLSINKGDSYDRDPNLQVAEECFFHRQQNHRVEKTSTKSETRKPLKPATLKLRTRIPLNLPKPPGSC